MPLMQRPSMSHVRICLSDPTLFVLDIFLFLANEDDSVKECSFYLACEDTDEV